MTSEKDNGTNAFEASHSPRIYVASLSDYNAGRLHGEWIDASQDAEAIHAAIRSMLAASRNPVAEEWAIHDYEGFGGLRLSEYESIDKVAEVASLLSEHGEMFGAVVNHVGGLEHLEDAKQYMEESYCGQFDDLGWYAAHMGEDLYHEQLSALPDFIRSNIDWDAIGRDLELGGDIFTIEHDGELHIFSGNF